MAKDDNTKYQIKIDYEDPFREKYSQEYNIDLSPIINATNFETRTVMPKKSLTNLVRLSQSWMTLRAT